MIIRKIVPHATGFRTSDSWKCTTRLVQSSALRVGSSARRCSFPSCGRICGRSWHVQSEIMRDNSLGQSVRKFMA